MTESGDEDNESTEEKVKKNNSVINSLEYMQKKKIIKNILHYITWVLTNIQYWE